MYYTVELNGTALRTFENRDDARLFMKELCPVGNDVARIVVSVTIEELHREQSKPWQLR
jgi:hypothetical protein